eukprot:gene8532-356_t
MNYNQLKLPYYYIFVSEDDNSITLITSQPLKQTKKDFPIGEYYRKFQYDNYEDFYNIANNFYIKVYRYDKDNLCYGLFLHKYPINVVYNDIFDLADSEYIEHDKIPHEELKGGNLFASIGEMF